MRFLQGNEAIFEGAMAAGATFYAGYPITPSSEIAELASRRLPAAGGVFLQMEDELASMAAVIGASLAGARAFTATSGPGFSLMQENIGLAIMAEVPCVVINVMRSGPSTGLATRPAQGDVMQARWGTHGDHSILALCPAGVQECFDLAVQAFNWAERLRCPVVLICDEVVGHMKERAVLPPPERLEVWGRKRPTGPPDSYATYRPEEDGIPPLGELGGPYIVHASGSMHDERGYPSSDPANAARVIRRLYRKVEDRRRDFPPARRIMTEGARVLVVSYGAAARAARESVLRARREGEPWGLLELKTLWPFPSHEVEELARGARVVAVAELNLGQVVLEVERAVGRSVPVVHVGRSDGEPLTPGQVTRALSGVA